MKINKLFFILFLSFLLNIFIVFSDYNYYGYNTFYESTPGYFNELNPFQMDRITIKPINNQKYVPIINDLNGDGINEIIVSFENILIIYQSNNLNHIIDIAMPDNINSIQIYEFNISKYIFLVDDNSIYIYSFNGSDLNHIKNYTSIFPASSTSDNIIRVSCDEEIETCISFATRSTSSGTVPRVITGYVKTKAFNLSDMGSEIEFISFNYNTQSSASMGSTTCAIIRDFISVDDINFNGKNEIVYSWLHETKEYAGYHYRNTYVIDFYNLNKNLTTNKPYNSVAVPAFSSQAKCGIDLNTYFTSPIFLEFDGIHSNGKELVFGTMASASTFRLKSYKQVGNTWSYVRQYPSVFTSDGVILSNPIKADAFADTGLSDVCVLGFKESESKLNLLCASEKTSTFYRSYEWDYIVPYNLSFNNNHIFSVYSGQHTSEQIKDNRFNFGHQYFNPTEFITPYGIFKLTMNKDLFFDWVYDMELIWENPFQNTMLFAYDVLNKGRVDLIGMSDTNLYYIDDGYTKSGAVISQQYFNPCLDTTWRVNTTLNVKFRVSDVDGDNVRAKAVLYEGQPFEQSSGWTNNMSSGTTFNFNFDVNETISNGILSIYGQDTSNPYEIDSYSYPISISSSFGIVFGECFTYIEGSEFGEIDIIEDISDKDKAIDKSDNIIRNIIVDINEDYNLGLGTTIIWLIITMCLIGGIFLSITSSKNHIPINVAMGFCLMIFLIMIIIGSYLGFITIGLLIILVILLLIVIGLSFGRLFFSHQQG